LFFVVLGLLQASRDTLAVNLLGSFGIT